MKTMKLPAALIILGLLWIFAVANVNVVAQDNSLSAITTSATITLDGEDSEAAWGDADSLSLLDVEGSGIDVTLKALHDDNYLYMYATWTDSTESNTRHGWSYDGVNWTNIGGNEDRMNFAWSIGGAEIACGHDPAGDDTTVLFDVWHWKASRTGPAGWADDKYWDGTGRHADTKTAGGYFDNSVVAQEGGNGTAITTALGNSSDVTAFSNEDRPFWDANGDPISWSGGVNSTPLTDFIPGYKTVLPAGSRGDVHTGSRHDGSAWHVEYRRVLATGNDDDIDFAVESTYTFYLSLHDNAGGMDHFRYGGFTPTAIQLSIVAGTTTATPPPTTTPPPPSIFDNTFVLIGIILAILGIAIGFARTLNRSS
ncbi:MAG: ethylbenzene dehydrogenase-related protein [Candidatus Thorarchaeota archaeon]